MASTTSPDLAPAASAAGRDGVRKTAASTVSGRSKSTGGIGSIADSRITSEKRTGRASIAAATRRPRSLRPAPTTTATDPAGKEESPCVRHGRRP